MGWKIIYSLATDDQFVFIFPLEQMHSLSEVSGHFDKRKKVVEIWDIKTMLRKMPDYTYSLTHKDNTQKKQMLRDKSIQKNNIGFRRQFSLVRYCLFPVCFDLLMFSVIWKDQRGWTWSSPFFSHFLVLHWLPRTGVVIVIVVVSFNVLVSKIKSISEVELAELLSSGLSPYSLPHCCGQCRRTTDCRCFALAMQNNKT